MYKRLIRLFAVLAFDTDTFNSIGEKHLTVGQRICINQERAFIMARMTNGLSDEYYQQSEIVEEKIKFIIKKIKDHNLTQAYAQHSSEHLEP